MKVIAIFLAIFVSRLVFADISIIGINGASNVNLKQVKPIIYGGTGGSKMLGSCGDGDTYGKTCNNCTAEKIPCNQKRIQYTTELSIRYISDSKKGNALMTTSNGIIIPLSRSSRGSSVGELALTWSTLCDELSLSSDCSYNNFNQSIFIGIDGNDDGDLDDNVDDSMALNIIVHGPEDSRGEINSCENSSDQSGVCAFKVNALNRAVRLNDLEPSGSFPRHDGIEFSSLRLHYSTKSFSSIHLGQTKNFVDFQIFTDHRGDIYIEPNTVKDLKNNKTYFFKISTEDEAGNLASLTSDRAIVRACGKKPEKNKRCQFRAVPKRRK